MNSIILHLVGYEIRGSAVIQNWNSVICSIDLNHLFIELDSYNEDSIPFKQAIPTLYQSVESATVDVYKVYQAVIRGQVISSKVFIHSLNI